jgi:hypothetical protein
MTKRGGENQFDEALDNVVIYDFDDTASGINAFGTAGLGASETRSYAGDSGGPALMNPPGPNPAPVIAGVLSWGDNDPATNAGGIEVDVTRYMFVDPVWGVRRWADGSIGEHGGYTTIAPYLPYINARVSEQIDLVLDMNYQTLGLTDSPLFPGLAENITINVENVGGNLEIAVTGADIGLDATLATLSGKYYSAPAANIKSLTLRGSSDNETFRIIGDLGISGNVYIDGRTGTNDVVYDFTGATVAPHAYTSPTTRTPVSITA